MERTFLRSPPAGIDLEQRLTFEALGYAIDALGLSYGRLRSAAMQFAPGKDEGLSRPLSISLFADAWSMIDEGHTIHCLLRVLAGHGGTKAARDFINKFDAATRLRNAMDHVHQQIRNIAEKKTRSQTVYGSLSYGRVFGKGNNLDVSSPDDVTGAYIVTLVAGALAKEKYRMRAANIAGKVMEFPIGYFQFNAFDHSIDLSQLAFDCEAVANFFNTDVHADVIRQLKDWAAANHVSESSALEPRAEGLAVVMEVKFKGDHPVPNEPEP